MDFEDQGLQAEWEKFDKGKRKAFCQAVSKKRAKVGPSSSSTSGPNLTGDQIAQITKALVDTFSKFIKPQAGKRWG
eukprot:1466561-Prorocentrum_lima.AAC.1